MASFPSVLATGPHVNLQRAWGVIMTSRVAESYDHRHTGVISSADSASWHPEVEEVTPGDAAAAETGHQPDAEPAFDDMDEAMIDDERPGVRTEFHGVLVENVVSVGGGSRGSVSPQPGRRQSYLMEVMRGHNDENSSGYCSGDGEGILDALMVHSKLSTGRKRRGSSGLYLVPDSFAEGDDDVRTS